MSEIAWGMIPVGEYGHTLNNPMYDSVAGKLSLCIRHLARI